jgi:hypothetical protein
VKLVRIAVVVAAIGLVGGQLAGAQASLPNSVCRGEDVVTIRSADLKTDRSRSTDLYRVVTSKLYISSDGRDEYFYGDVRQVEPGRYTSGHKTIIFEGPGFRRATVIHTDELETRVLKLRCTAS